MNTVIIAGFPGTGKTWCVNNLKEKYNMEDSDSSYFSWLYNEKKEKTEIRNPEFPENYVNYIKSQIGKVDIIFVSTHKEVRKALMENQIPYVLVYPENTEDNKIDYIARFLNRDSSTAFIEKIKENWDNFLSDIGTEQWPVHYVLSSSIEPTKKYLKDVIEDIVEVNSDYYKVEE